MNKIVTTIITSGGNSTRFGSNKLLEKIGNLTVIEHTISKFLEFSSLIVIPAKEDIVETIKNSKLYEKFGEKITFAHAGETRQKSVYNGLKTIKKTDVVLIHDGARPFIDKDTIKKTIDLTFEKGAVVVGQMAVDTIKMVENGKIIKTLDRKQIFQAQTPQAFSFDLILKIHEKYKDSPNFTDDSSMAEAYGKSVYIIDNKNKNIKITTKKDLE